MTVPDTAPTVEDVIAEALLARDAEDVAWIDRYSAEKYAAAVVAAIRAMTAEQLVDLRPDLTVEHGLGALGPADKRGARTRPDTIRVVGPWQETPSLPVVAPRV